jgi:drug/metabolite transporter (DMT)-like permease
MRNISISIEGVFARPTHLAAVFSALLVTFLWSTSFLLVKLSLPFVPPVTLAAVRYLLAFLFLLAYALLLDRRRPVRLAWMTLIVIGIFNYGASQGLQYSAMRVLPVATIALLFCLLPPIQAIADTIWLREPPAPVELVGAAVTLGGVALYLPWGGSIAWVGLLMMAGTLIAVTIGTTLSRKVAREGATSTLHLTLVSIGAGALSVLPVGLLGEPAPRFPLFVVGALLWLALANTAVAWSLWNHALRTLTAFEANLVANTTVFQVGVLGWIFLGEPLTGRQIVAIAVAFGGVLLAQLPALRTRRPAIVSPSTP